MQRALVTGASDVDVLASARSEERTLVTENVRDYRPLESGLLAGAPDEGQPLDVFLASGRLADEHDSGLRVAVGEHQAGRGGFKRAAVESKHSAVKRSYSSGSSSVPVFDNERQTQDAPG